MDRLMIGGIPYNRDCEPRKAVVVASSRRAKHRQHVGLGGLLQFTPGIDDGEQIAVDGTTPCTTQIGNGGFPRCFG